MGTGVAVRTASSPPMAILQLNRPSSDLHRFLAHHLFPTHNVFEVAKSKNAPVCRAAHRFCVPLRRMVFLNTDHESRP
jgi:hypothetical protein